MRVFSNPAFKHEGPCHGRVIRPLRVFPFSIAVNGDELRLKHMLDQAIGELKNTEYIDRMLVKYDPDKFFLPAVKSYGER